MKIFTIEAETNNITVHATAKEAGAVANAEQFRNQVGLAKLAAKWPAARLVEIWNSLPGAERMKKFKDRNTAVERIWKAIQSLTPATPEASEPAVPEPATAAPEAPQTPDVAPKGKASGKKVTPAKKAPKTPTKAKKARQGSKTETILDLLKRPGGVSATELMETTGWQAHSVRGFLSGTIKKKLGLTVVSTKGEDKERNYSVKS
jgi:type IV secretory pathway VirB10-like protein